VTAADDAVVLAVLDAVANLNVHDGDVPDSDAATSVIAATLPYVVFYAMTDNPAVGDALAGTSGAYLTEFQLTGVGDSREQAKLALERARAVLDRKRLTFPSGSRFVRRTDVNQFVRRDDTWTRPGGAPLFFGVDRYAVAI
jgi:hypothetical protein